jgi:hypothetical protein
MGDDSALFCGRSSNVSSALPLFLRSFANFTFLFENHVCTYTYFRLSRRSLKPTSPGVDFISLFRPKFTDKT